MKEKEIIEKFLNNGNTMEEIRKKLNNGIRIIKEIEIIGKLNKKNSFKNIRKRFEKN